MPRRALVLMLLASAPAVAADPSPRPAVQSAKDVMPVPKLEAGAERKPVERMAGEAPKRLRDTPKVPLSAPEDKSLGLGCAES